MAVTYKKLFHLLIDKGMTNAEPMEQAGFSANMITRIKHDNYISLDSIEKICKALQCGVDDILEFTPEKVDALLKYLILTETKVCTRLKRHGATSLPNRKKS